MLKKASAVCLFVLCCLQTVYSYAEEQCNLDIINPAVYNKILDYLLIEKKDVTLYKKAFRAVDNADFERADDFMSSLGNNIILGHVLAEKYLHKKYKASFSELKDWMDKYPDLPQAGRIYNLALKKGRAATLAKPRQMSDSTHILGWKDEDLKHLSPGDLHYLTTQVARFRKALRSGKTKPARQILEQKRFRLKAPNKYWDELAASLAMKYLVDNQNKLAWQWGMRAAKRGTSAVAPWVAGLSAWRMKNYKSAATYFSRLAHLKSADDWMLSAGGYWAYRAYSRSGQKTTAKQMLKQAARYRHTFYGILAAYKSGQQLTYHWDAVAYLNNFNSLDYIYELLGSPSIRRAIILLHAKRKDLAEQELKHGYYEMTDKQKEATLYIANQYQMHALAIRVCGDLNRPEEDMSYDGVAYPTPSWIPDENWQVDKALVLALIRQESGFKPEAKSPAGAKGLMQLMPNTAYHITKDISIKRDNQRLLKPEVSIEIGQRYVNYLLNKPFIKGNLFYMMAAYNGGPSNMLRWEKTAEYNDDPLLFIEVIPSAETRIYIERVMANYWIYNMKFDLPNPTLQQVAEGHWPVLPRD